MPISQWDVSKFTEEHNHDLATLLEVTRHCSHSSSHKSPANQRLVRLLNVDGPGPSNIARIRNIVNGSTEQYITAAHCSQLIRSMRNNIDTGVRVR